MTDQYRNRINEIADGIKHEPEMRKMRDDLSEGIKTTGNRQADVEEQFQQVIQETTDKDIVSAPEIIAARNGKDNLKKRIDDFEDSTNAQLAQTESQIDDIHSFKDFEVNDKGRGRIKQGVTTFWDDDGHISVYENMYPIFEQEGVPFATAIIPTWVGTGSRMNLTQIHELEQSGHEITSHSYDHLRFPEVSDELAELDFLQSKQWFLENNLDVNNFALPFGDLDTKTKYLAKKYWRSMRTSDNGRNRTNISPFETHALKAIWFMETGNKGYDDVSGFNGDTFEYYKFYIDKAKEEKSWLIISSHSPNIRDNSVLYRQVVNYAKTQTEIMTPNQALNYFGNIIEVGDYTREDRIKPHFAVGYDGTIHRNGFDTVYLGFNAVNNDTPIDGFEVNKISITHFLNNEADDAGMPARAGTLWTYRLTQAGEGSYHNYQEYHTITGDIYRRWWNVAANTWPGWTEIVTEQRFIVADSNTHNLSTPITEFPIGVTNCMINTSNATGSPNGVGGTLIVHKVTDGGSSQNFNWRVYHEIAGGMYKQNISPTGDYLAWQPI